MVEEEEYAGIRRRLRCPSMLRTALGQIMWHRVTDPGL